ncbi:MAG TPA: type II toxin-antitoxin system Phd/YefM family antitoxin [Bacilli bacterium]
MNKRWQIQEAKNRLSQVVNQAVNDGPQIITVRGKPAVILLSFEEYQRITKPKTSLADFFKNSPLSEVELELERSTDMPREVDL